LKKHPHLSRLSGSRFSVSTIGRSFALPKNTQFADRIEFEHVPAVRQVTERKEEPYQVSGVRYQQSED